MNTPLTNPRYVRSCSAQSFVVEEGWSIGWSIAAMRNIHQLRGLIHWVSKDRGEAWQSSLLANGYLGETAVGAIRRRRKTDCGSASESLASRRLRQCASVGETVRMENRYRHGEHDVSGIDDRRLANFGDQGRAAQHGEQEPPTRRLQDAHSRRRPRRRRHDRHLRLAPRADPGRGAGTDRRDTQRLCRFLPLHADVNLTRPGGCFGSQPIAVTLVMTSLRDEQSSVVGARVRARCDAARGMHPRLVRR
jgi:hypothetical protein